MRHTEPVLVCGAGPVGLATAAWLAQFNVPVRIIDLAPEPTSLSKALVVWRRTLHALAPLVPPERFIAAGAPLHGMVLCDSGRLVGSLDLSEYQGKEEHRRRAAATSAPPPPAASHALPPGVLLSQATTEALLTAALRDRGVSVDRGVRLVSFSQQKGEDGGSGGWVECELERVGAGGAAPASKELFRASFVVGADGAHSAVRKLMAVAFLGSGLPNQRFWLADIRAEPATKPPPPPALDPESGAAAAGAPAAGAGPAAGAATRKAAAPQLETELAPGRLYMSTSPEGLIAIVPFNDEGSYRFIQDGGEADPDAPRGPGPTLAQIQSALDGQTRLQLQVTEVGWTSEFGVQERVAERFWDGGAAFLAGDAAHVHSPAGGQGMNTGLQDATNLAWKLALAHSGEATPQLLDSYQAERQPIAKQVVVMSGRLLRVNIVKSPVLRALRRALLSTLLRFSAARRAFAASVTGDTINYSSSPLAAGAPAASKSAAARPGRAFPDLKLSAGTSGSSLELLCCAPRGAMGTLVLGPEADAGAWPCTFGSLPLTVRKIEPGEVGEVAAAALMAALGIGRREGALVRPDGVVAASGGPEAAREWLGSCVGSDAKQGMSNNPGLWSLFCMSFSYFMWTEP